MGAIENAAYLSVGRACGFAGLGVFCLVFGLSFEPVLAARAGGTVSLVVTLVLAWRGLGAPTRPYRQTEVWLILAKDERPTEGVAQRVIGTVLQEAYWWFAQQAAVVSIILLAASVGLHVAASI